MLMQAVSFYLSFFPETAPKCSITPASKVGRAWLPSGVTPAVSKVGALRRGLKTNTGKPRKSSAVAGAPGKADVAVASVNCSWVSLLSVGCILPSGVVPASLNVPSPTSSGLYHSCAATNLRLVTWFPHVTLEA